MALDAPSEQRAAAEAKTAPLEKVKAWCAIAATTLRAARVKAGGMTRVDFQPARCRLSVDKKAACQGRCAGAPCDVTANPMTCANGTLSNGVCEGGTLEGGCMVDAKCDASCDLSVICAADCPAPSVTASVMGAADPATATKLEELLRADLPAVLALRAHFEAEASATTTVTGNLVSITDIKTACIPMVLSEAAGAAAEIVAGFQAAEDVVATVR